MKFVLYFGGTVILVFILSQSIHWMAGILVLPLPVYLARMKPGRAFMLGFFGVGLAWCIYAYWLSAENDHLLSSQVGDLFGHITPLSLSVVTAVLGGLGGALVGASTALVSSRKN